MNFSIVYVWLPKRAYIYIYMLELFKRADAESLREDPFVPCFPSPELNDPEFHLVAFGHVQRPQEGRVEFFNVWVGEDKNSLV